MNVSMHFIKSLTPILKHLSPLKKCKQNSHFPNWMDSSTKSLIIQKKVAHVEYKKSQSTDDYARYSQLRSKCKDAILSCKQSYIVRTENDILSNSKSFWSYIRSKKDSNTVPKVMYLSNNQAQSPSYLPLTFNRSTKDIITLKITVPSLITFNP